jgi:hypothetical protein
MNSVTSWQPGDLFIPQGLLFKAPGVSTVDCADARQEACFIIFS